MNIYSIGDSITFGYGSSNSSKIWAKILSESLGANHINKSVSGDMVADRGHAVYSTAPSIDDISTIMLGTNDERIYGIDSAKREKFKSGLLAEAAWLSTDRRASISNASFIGSWTNTAVYGIGKRSITAGDKVIFRANGTVIYLGFIQQHGTGGQFTVKIDGILKGTFDNYGFGIGTANGASYGPKGMRFDGLSDGAHDVEIEIVSSTSSSNIVYFDWFSGNNPKGKLLIVDIPYAKNYTSGGSDANVDLYNIEIKDIASQLYNDGLDVSLVSANSFLSKLTDMYDDYHPNDSGHAKISSESLKKIGFIKFTEVKIYQDQNGSLYYGDNKIPLL